MLRILSLLLLLSGSVYGQTPADSALTDPMLLAYKPPQLTAADTIEALHLLFRNSRATGGLLVGLGGIAAIATPVIYAASSGPSTSTYGNLPQAIGGTGLGFIIATPIAVFGLSQLSKNSKEKEAEAVRNYTNSRLLPKRLKRRLRPELFLTLRSLSLHR